ncbi:hypothetical protein GOV04_03930 [Candidatus Woesearchaeota archaeon]|nr:hypothetical protein [Candidatus Woesearchaeota archaeon]
MTKAKKLLTNWRVLLLLFFLLMAVVSIHPAPNNSGVAIRSVLPNSTAANTGFESPKPNANPLSWEVIKTINGIEISSEAKYFSAVSDLQVNQTILISTNKKTYKLTVEPLTKITILNQTTTQRVIEEVFDEELNKTINKTKLVKVPQTLTEILGPADLGLKISKAPTTNIRKGLDLQGGTRVLLQPVNKTTAEDMELIISNMNERLNVFGLSDVLIRTAGDLSGNQYIIVEIAGANEEEVKNLLAKQGKFEAKVVNNTVFKGSKKDIAYVCRSSQCAGIDPSNGCGPLADGNFVCNFRFAITLSNEAAENFASSTQDLQVVTNEQGDDYLSEKIDFLLDDNLITSLNIVASLKGQAQTDISITGSAIGPSEQEAAFNAINEMKRLQSILSSGSLPTKIEIVQTSNVSPLLGNEFTKNAILVGIVAIFVVSLVVFIRYRKWQIAIPMTITMASEVILLLGFASIVAWNLDLAAIAGIIIAVGTGVDHQIIIADETLRGEALKSSWRERLKNAFFIIMVAYSTTVVAMVPLLVAGAGLLKGFAFTTIVGVSLGVFLTRPAFASIIEILLKK